MTEKSLMRIGRTALNGKSKERCRRPSDQRSTADYPRRRERGYERNEVTLLVMMSFSLTGEFVLERHRFTVYPWRNLAINLYYTILLHTRFIFMIKSIMINHIIAVIKLNLHLISNLLSHFYVIFTTRYSFYLLYFIRTNTIFNKF